MHVRLPVSSNSAGEGSLTTPSYSEHFLLVTGVTEVGSLLGNVVGTDEGAELDLKFGEELGEKLGP